MNIAIGLAILCGIFCCSVVNGQRLPRLFPRGGPSPAPSPPPPPPPPPPPSGGSRSELRAAAQINQATRKSQAIDGNGVAVSSQGPPKVINAATAQRAGVFQQPVGITFLITDTHVIYLGVSYPIVDGKVTINGYIYLVCGDGIAWEQNYICCLGNIYDKAMGNIACCGDVFYLTDSEICCKDYYFYPKYFRGEPLGCCDADPYFLNTESCCNNVIVEGQTCGQICTDGFICCNGQQYPENPFLGCCNDAWYSTSLQQCCNNQIILSTDVCPTSGCTETATQFCCQGTAFPKNFGVACCNDVFYLTSVQNCCPDNTLVPIGQSCDVCPANTVCCNGQQIPDTFGVGCCNGQLYTLSGFDCCQNTIISTTAQCCIGGFIVNSPC